MYPVLPVLYKFPLVAVQACVDMRRIFCREAMHTFSCGLSFLLMECISTMPKDETRTTESKTKKTRSRKTFKSARKTVLRSASQLLALVQCSLMGYSQHTDFAEWDRSDRLDRLFTDSGLVGMIEGKDDNCINMVVPFKAGMVDGCDDLDDAQITQMFESYVVLQHRLLWFGESSKLVGPPVEKLQTQVRSFKTIADKIFAKFQPPRFRACKWPAMDYLADSLLGVGNMHAVHNEMYESSQRLLKTLYRRTTKRPATVMEESVCVRNMAEDETSKSPKLRNPLPVALPMHQNTVRTGGDYLVTSGFYGFFWKLRHAKFFL